MGRNAARRAGSSSSRAASTDSVSTLASELSAIATASTSLLDSLNERQMGIDFKFYLAPHNHLSVVRLRMKWYGGGKVVLSVELCDTKSTVVLNLHKHNYYQCRSDKDPEFPTLVAGS
ncbi:hypothetical protein OSB04_030955 [Centaurea solstitialis]|uniref:Uncharacterized protein n=1 Tax=Centaurea solstitialis TaxID=347529 RepID=A0AA38VTU2_9ASTR|nr:hypothetical protein OSB04_030955 [Centaurea solstitialis]